MPAHGRRGVAEALGDEQAGLRAPALQQRVGSDRGAVGEDADAAEELARSRPRSAAARANVARTPSTRLAGVVGDLYRRDLADASITTVSVKVPPISEATKYCAESLTSLKFSSRSSVAPARLFNFTSLISNHTIQMRKWPQPSPAGSPAVAKGTTAAAGPSGRQAPSPWKRSPRGASCGRPSAAAASLTAERCLHVVLDGEADQRLDGAREAIASRSRVSGDLGVTRAAALCGVGEARGRRASPPSRRRRRGGPTCSASSTGDRDPPAVGGRRRPRRRPRRRGAAARRAAQIAAASSIATSRWRPRPVSRACHPAPREIRNAALVLGREVDPGDADQRLRRRAPRRRAPPASAR